MVATGSPSPCVKATSDPSSSVRAVSSSVARVTGRLQTSPSGRRISSTTLSYSSRSIKPSRGLKTPVEIICRSEAVREPRETFGSSATSLRRSSRSSAGIVRSTSCPPWGATESSFFSIKFLSRSARRFRRALARTAHWRVALRLSNRRYPCRDGDGFGGQLVVVGQAMFVRVPQLPRELRVLTLRRFDPRALLCLLVPSFPALPPPHLPRLPRKSIRSERYLQVLAVGGEHAHRVLAEGHRVHDHDVLRVQLRRVPEQPIQLFEASLFQGEVGPHLVERGQYVLGIPDDKGVLEAGDELRSHQALGVVGHVLDEDPFFAGLEDPRQDVLVIVLRLRLRVRVAVAQALLTVVIRVPERLVEDLEVVSLDEGPLERGGYGPGHRPQRNGFLLYHTSLSLVHLGTNAAFSVNLRGGLPGTPRETACASSHSRAYGATSKFSSARGAGDHALFLKAPHHLSSASRRGARYASGVPTPSRKERVRSQSTWPSVSSPLHALFRSPGSAARS